MNRLALAAAGVAAVVVSTLVVATSMQSPTVVREPVVPASSSSATVPSRGVPLPCEKRPLFARRRCVDAGAP